MLWPQAVVNLSVWAGALTSSVTVLLSSSSSSSKANTNANAAVVQVVAGMLSLLFAYNAWTEMVLLWMSAKLPPGRSGLPIVGCLPDFMSDPEDFNKRLVKQYGPFCTFTLLRKPVVRMWAEEDAAWCLTQERKGVAIPPKFMLAFEKVLGKHNILLLHGKMHKRIRRLMEPGFTPNAVKTYVNVVDSVFKAEYRRWYEQQDDAVNEGFCMPICFSRATLRVLLICAFGQVGDTELEEMSTLLKQWADGVICVIPFDIPGSTMAKSTAAGKKLRDIIKPMVDDFKAKHAPESSMSSSTLMGRMCYSTDETGDSLSTDQIIQNLMLIMFAGHDTTRGTLSTILSFLAKHPYIYDLLEEEVSSFKDPLDFNEMKEAPILNAFLAEIWRCVSALYHHLTELQETRTYKDYVLRKGTMLSMGLSGLHSDLPCSSSFHLERWLPHDHPLFDPSLAHPSGKVPSCNKASLDFRTFNLGPHTCLGAEFARLETRVALIRLVQHYHRPQVRNVKRVPMLIQSYECEFKLVPKKANVE